MSTTRTGGGAATQVGIHYQNRVAAWIVVSILSEQDSALPWDLPNNVTLKFIRCETEQFVDDLLVGTSDGGHVFIQVKHQLSLGEEIKSPLGSTINQFVQQFLAYENEIASKRPWERSLDAARDRLVLITSSGSSASIREDLPSVLAKIRDLPADQSISDVVLNSNKHEDVFHKIIKLIQDAWYKDRKITPTDKQIRDIIKLIRIQVLDVDADGRDELQAKDRLRSSILSQPTQADTAWSSLIQICTDLAVNQSGGDQPILQRRLSNNGISLKSIPSYQADINRLRDYSRTTIDKWVDPAKIQVGNQYVKIDRQVTSVLKAAAQQESLLVVGEQQVKSQNT